MGIYDANLKGMQGGWAVLENRAQHTSCSQDNCHSKDSSSYTAVNLTAKTTHPKGNASSQSDTVECLVGTNFL